tara:strand:- start:198 stop:356 length:159 start_codon:yes stop_codon:yes gene_type:complete
MVILKVEGLEEGLLKQPDRTKRKRKVKTSFENIFVVQIDIIARNNWVNSLIF